ncbi:MAG TPA: DEAD/DEAH box helicase, partial [Candidatus Tectomicrobia bacterium]
MARSGPAGSVTALLAHVRDVYASRITGEATLPARAGSYSELPPDLDVRLRLALQQRSITQLYSHQHAAWEAVRAGQHTVIVTPTASGKTLCYNLPVLQSILRDNVKALYLFPTKA